MVAGLTVHWHTDLAEIDAHAQDGGVDLWRAPNTDWA